MNLFGLMETSGSAMQAERMRAVRVRASLGWTRRSLIPLGTTDRPDDPTNGWKLPAGGEAGRRRHGDGLPGRRRDAGTQGGDQDAAARDRQPAGYQIGRASC